jgi:hypothetical protein
MGASSLAMLTLADEVWVTVALLHRENPHSADFSVDEIVQRRHAETAMGSVRPGYRVHVLQHCVANRPANPGRLRVLVETGPGRRRLYRPGDPYHPDRESAKWAPNAHDLPSGYRDLLGWYESYAAAAKSSLRATDPLLVLRGSGKSLWADEHADDYVRRLREGWE